MLSEQTNLDLISNITKFNKNVKQVREINYFLKGNNTDKSILVYLGFQDNFASVDELALVISDLYKYLGQSDEKRFMAGVLDNKIASPIYFAGVLNETQRNEIMSRLNVSLTDVANNLVRLVPK